MSISSNLPLDLTAMIAMVEDVPMISDLHEHVHRLIAGGGGAEELGRIVSDDPMISQLMLHQANSAFNATSKAVESVDRAIALLGVNAVERLVKQASLSTALRPFSSQSMTAYWRHCYTTAQAARLLADETRVAYPEEAFACALLMRVGQALLLAKFPNEYKMLLENVEESGTYLLDAEKEMFGADHCQLGYMLGRRWRLESGMVDMIRTRSNPERAGDQLGFAVLLYLADTITSGLGIGSTGFQRLTRSPVKAKTWKELGWMELALEPICARVLLAADEFEGFWELLTGSKQEHMGLEPQGRF